MRYIFLAGLVLVLGSCETQYNPGPAHNPKTEPSTSPAVPEETVDLSTLPATREGFLAAVEEFRKVRDDREEIDHDSDEFLTLVRHFIQTLSAEDASEQVDKETDILDAFERPAEVAGTFMRFQGRVITPYAEIVSRSNPTGTRQVTRIFMEAWTPGKPNRTVIVYFAEPPVDGKTGRTLQWNGYFKNKIEFFCTDHVEIEGVFLRLFEYEVQTPRDPSQPYHRASVFFARNVKKIEAPPKGK